jgi:hypothetical protein
VRNLFISKKSVGLFGQKSECLVEDELLRDRSEVLPQYSATILGAFAKLRRATIIFVMSAVCQSVCPSFRSHKNNSAPTGQVFIKLYIPLVFRKSVEKIQIYLKSD